MACLQLLTRACQRQTQPGQGTGAGGGLRRLRRCAWPAVMPPRVCLRPRTHESPASEPAQEATRQSLPAQGFGVMGFPADAFRRRHFVLRAPGEQPGFHVFIPDIVARLYLTVGLTNLRQHALLIGHVRLDGVRNQEIRAAAGTLGQPSQAFLDLGFQADAEGAATCVRHEHIITRGYRTRLRFCQRPTPNDQRP